MRARANYDKTRALRLASAHLFPYPEKLVSPDEPDAPPHAPPHSDSTLSIPRAFIDAIFGADDAAALSLVVLEGREVGRRVKISEQPLTAGRDPHAGIVLVDSGVSRLHCRVALVDGAIVVEDLGSTNGTYVDGRPIRTRTRLTEGSILRIGEQVFRCERCSSRDLDRAEEQQRDLERATNYVRSLLPPPLAAGPMRTEWMLLPSARLGGDAFGYGQLDDHRYSLYLIDVSGHGVGAAMHSVSIVNMLRQHALPATDLTDPVEVLSQLNAMFQMDRYDDQCFTMWYGVYDVRDRSLVYASAGHHPGFLVAPPRTHADPLRTPGLVLGAMLGARYQAARTQVPADSTLYLFSDGVFEVSTAERHWRLADFIPVLTQPAAGVDECRRIYRAVRAVCPGPLEDDFSILVVTFP